MASSNHEHPHLKIRGAKPASELLITNPEHKKKTITPAQIDANMEQWEYEVNNKEVIKSMFFLNELSEDEQNEKNLSLRGNYPENEFLKIQCAHYLKDKEWEFPFRGGSQSNPYLFDPPPKGFNFIHRRFLQMMQDLLMYPNILKKYSMYILNHDKEKDSNWNKLTFNERCKIINAFWFIYFGTDKYPNFIIDPTSEDLKDDVVQYKNDKKIFYFDKTHDGRYVKWESFPINMYDVSPKPDSFNKNHGEMNKLFLKSFIFYINTKHKDEKKSYTMKIDCILKIIISNYEKMFDETFDNLSEITKKNYIEINEVNNNYISILSMSKNSLIFLVRKWSNYMWNSIPEKESDKVNIPEDFMIVPHIIGNNIEWINVKIRMNYIK